MFTSASDTIVSDGFSTCDVESLVVVPLIATATLVETDDADVIVLLLMMVFPSSMSPMLYAMVRDLEGDTPLGDDDGADIIGT